MISLSDRDALRLLTLDVIIPRSCFPTFSVSKCLQNSSIYHKKFVRYRFLDTFAGTIAFLGAKKNCLIKTIYL